jgi:hypothetical protein
MPQLRSRDLVAIATVATIGAVVVVYLDSSISDRSAPIASGETASAPLTSPGLNAESALEKAETADSRNAIKLVEPPSVDANHSATESQVMLSAAPPGVEPLSTGSLPSSGTDLDPTQCMPAALRQVLDDVASRFGAVTIVSTTRLKTDNHFPGSTREALHGACRAVDFRVEGPLPEVVRYLRGRREIAGLNSYRSGLIHMDVDESRKPD